MECIKTNAGEANALPETYLDGNGYLRNKDTDKLVHRVVYSKVFRQVRRDWVIHHVNGVKTDNVPWNLIALPRALHSKIHHIFNHKEILPTKEECMQYCYRMESSSGFGRRLFLRDISMIARNKRRAIQKTWRENVKIRKAKKKHKPAFVPKYILRKKAVL